MKNLASGENNFSDIHEFKLKIFIARQHTATLMMMRDIAILSVRLSVRPYTLVGLLYENDLTYRHSFFTIR